MFLEDRDTEMKNIESRVAVLESWRDDIAVFSFIPFDRLIPFQARGLDRAPVIPLSGVWEEKSNEKLPKSKRTTASLVALLFRIRRFWIKNHRVADIAQHLRSVVNTMLIRSRFY